MFSSCYITRHHVLLLLHNTLLYSHPFISIVNQTMKCYREIITFHFCLNNSFLTSLYYIIRLKQTYIHTNKCSCSDTNSSLILVDSVCLQEKETKLNFLTLSGVFVLFFLLFIFSFKLIPFALVLHHLLPFFFFVFVFSFCLVLLLVASHALQTCSYHYLSNC
jgi:hypothetical protein